MKGSTLLLRITFDSLLLCILPFGQTPGRNPPSPSTLTMEHARVRDDNRSPPPTEDPTAPFIQVDLPRSAPGGGESSAGRPAWPSPPPSTMNPQYTEKSWFSRFRPPRSKPLFRGFERPSFSRIAILTVLCLTAYPAFYSLTFVAKDRTLYIVRLIVSVWCSVIGFALGYIPLTIGAQHLEAASEFTLVWYRDFLSL